MFPDTLTIANAAAVDRTFNKISSTPTSVKYGLSTNCTTDQTFLEIRYQTVANKQGRLNMAGTPVALSYQIKRLNVKMTRRMFSTAALMRWVEATSNTTLVYEDHGQSIDSPALKDILAFQANFTKVGSNVDLMLLQSG